jgi:hypothetical protein
MTAFIALLCFRSGFESKITVESKDALVDVVVKQIAKDAGVQCQLPKSTSNLKVSVFAKDVEAKGLLDRIASTLGLDGKIVDGKYVFAPGPEFAGAVLDNYMRQEYALRDRMIYDKLAALANLTLKPYDPDAMSDAPGTPAQKWAQGRIAHPAYYALGVAFRRGYFEARARKGLPRDCFTFMPGPGTGMVPQQTSGFLVGVPIREQLLDNPTCPVYIDDNCRAIRGQLIAFGFYPTTAELKLVSIAGAPTPTEPVLETPYYFARPPKELAKMPFAQMVSRWETPLDQFPVAMAKLKLDPEAGDAEDPGYFDERTSLSEKLQRLHAQSGLPIVATSFRIPALKPSKKDFGNVGDAIASLQSDEKCFLRAEDGFLLVRHPAYWLIRYSEPPEWVVAGLEAAAKKRPLTIGDYADLAFATSKTPDYGTGGTNIPHSFDRLVNLRGLLMRIDGEPLEMGYPALYVLGSMSAANRSALWSGGVLDSINVDGTIVRDRLGHIASGSRWSGRGNPLPHELVSCAPLFDAPVTTYFLTADERGVDSAKEMGDAFARDSMAGVVMDQFTDAWTLGMRARFLWLEPNRDNGCTFFAGFRDLVSTSYNISIHAK